LSNSNTNLLKLLKGWVGAGALGNLHKNLIIDLCNLPIDKMKKMCYNMYVR
jgi:hypothetical protein